MCRQVDQHAAKWEITCEGLDCSSLRTAAAKTSFLMANILWFQSWSSLVIVISDILGVIYHTRQQTWPCLALEITFYLSIISAVLWAWRHRGWYVLASATAQDGKEGL